MKTTWKRASIALLDRDQKIGTVSVFLDYDLRCWLFGATFDNDDYWFDGKLSFGPIGLSIMYWRKHVYMFRH